MLNGAGTTGTTVRHNFIGPTSSAPAAYRTATPGIAIFGARAEHDRRG